MAKITQKKKPAYEKRSDHGASIDGYFNAIADPEIRSRADGFRAIVEKHASKATSTIKWGVPCWDDHGLLCAIAAFKKHISLQFYDAGTSLNDPKGILEGTGKGCRHVKWKLGESVDQKAAATFIKEAIAFNRGR